MSVVAHFTQSLYFIFVNLNYYAKVAWFSFCLETQKTILKILSDIEEHLIIRGSLIGKEFDFVFKGLPV